MKIEATGFNIRDSILSGQCFRVTEEIDGSFTVILFDRVINVKKDNNWLLVKSNDMSNLKEIIIEYFDLDRDYNSINKELEIDDVMKDCISKCNGYKIFKQNPFEMCISYIISQNNNVKRISKSIDLLCTIKGKKVIFNGKTHYLFPTYEELKDITYQELRSTGIGFRDKYIRDYLDKFSVIRDINKLDTNDAIEELCKIRGIGLKVSSCILLFGYARLDVFPIDTWVKHFISDKYNIKNDQKTIEQFSKNKFGKYSGLAIQYMFHSERNK